MARLQINSELNGNLVMRKINSKKSIRGLDISKLSIFQTRKAREINVF